MSTFPAEPSNRKCLITTTLTTRGRNLANSAYRRKRPSTNLGSSTKDNSCALSPTSAATSLDNMLLLLVLSPILALAKYIVPLPEGAYGVSLQDVLVVDHNVPDPYLNLSYSRVPISISSPTGPSADCHQVLTPYMPLTTAEFWEKEITSVYKLPLNHTLTATSLTVCKPNATQPKTKVALLLPGAGFSRYFYVSIRPCHDPLRSTFIPPRHTLTTD